MTGLGALIRRNVKLFFHDKGMFFTSLITPVILLVLLLVVLRLALSPLHLFTKLPVVHGVNALLGGALGLVKGALLVFLAVWVLQKLQLLVTPELVDKTVLLKFFARNSPIDLIAKL